MCNVFKIKHKESIMSDYVLLYKDSYGNNHEYHCTSQDKGNAQDKADKFFKDNGIYAYCISIFETGVKV